MWGECRRVGKGGWRTTNSVKVSLDLRDKYGLASSPRGRACIFARLYKHINKERENADGYRIVRANENQKKLPRRSSME